MMKSLVFGGFAKHAGVVSGKKQNQEKKIYLTEAQRGKLKGFEGMKVSSGRINVTSSLQDFNCSLNERNLRKSFKKLERDSFGKGVKGKLQYRLRNFKTFRPKGVKGTNLFFKKGVYTGELKIKTQEPNDEFGYSEDDKSSSQKDSLHTSSRTISSDTSLSSESHAYDKSAQERRDLLLKDFEAFKTVLRKEKESLKARYEKEMQKFEKQTFRARALQDLYTTAQGQYANVAKGLTLLREADELDNNKKTHDKLDPYQALLSDVQSAYEKRQESIEGLNFSEKYTQRISLDFGKIPSLSKEKNVSNCSQITFGDVHGNAVLFFHFLVDAGFLEIADPAGFEKSIAFINDTEQASPLDFRPLLKEAFRVPEAAKGCLLRLIGDLLSDRGQNDLYILEILNLLKSNGVSLSSKDVDGIERGNILFSNHDGDFLAWYFNGLSFDNPKRKNLFLLANDRSQNHSLTQLDASCQRDPAVKERVKELVEGVYLPALSLLRVEDVRGKKIFLSHAPVTQEVLEGTVSRLVEVDVLDEPDSSTTDFEKILVLQEIFETALKNPALFQKVYPCFEEFIWFRGGETKEASDLTLPEGIHHVVHGHTEAFWEMEAFHQGHENSSDEIFTNGHAALNYLTTDGGFGKPGSKQQGTRQIFFVPA